MPRDGDFYKRLLDNLASGVYFVDRGRRITYWNRGAEAISGYRAASVVGRRCGDGILMHVDAKGTELCGDSCPLAATMADGEAREVEVLLHHEDGHRVPVRVKAEALRDARGRIVGAVEIFDENRERQVDHERIVELERLALLDSLTQLGNRRFAEIQLEAKLAELDRFGRGFGLLFFDVDEFKRVNDKYGHEAGDRVLRMVARTARVCVRPFDHLCRWGGDEYLALIAYVDGEGLARVSEKIRALVEASSIEVGGAPTRVTISGGGALARPADVAPVLLARADRLMYASKAAGGNRVTLPQDASSY
jgi:diguanylate cyclase (GGDEF)-like protein/PAS domain S-box-containing protein